MIQQDTVRLLRQCDAGARMGIASIDDVLPHVHSSALRHQLGEYRRRHEILCGEIGTRLERFHDTGKAPNPIAKVMSHLKTGAKLALHDSDKTVASLMCEGCRMGIESLSKYLRQYEAADRPSKGIAKDLIRLERQMADGMTPYL